MWSVGDLILKAQQVHFHLESTSNTCGWNVMRRRCLRWRSLTSWPSCPGMELGHPYQKHSLLSWPVWSCCFAVCPCLSPFVASYLFFYLLTLIFTLCFIQHCAWCGSSPWKRLQGTGFIQIIPDSSRRLTTLLTENAAKPWKISVRPEDPSALPPAHTSAMVSFLIDVGDAG